MLLVAEHVVHAERQKKCLEFWGKEKFIMSIGMHFRGTANADLFH